MVSQLVTLYLTPVMYIYMEAAQAKVRSWKQRHKRGGKRQEDGSRRAGTSASLDQVVDLHIFAQL